MKDFVPFPATNRLPERCPICPVPHPSPSVCSPMPCRESMTASPGPNQERWHSPEVKMRVVKLQEGERPQTNAPMASPSFQSVVKLVIGTPGRRERIQLSNLVLGVSSDCVPSSLCCVQPIEIE